MPYGDTSNDIPQSTPDFGSGRGMSPSLSEQTPGLDKTSRVRNLAMRPVSYARERPAVVLSIVGGMIVLGIGTWLALRSRKPTRWEMMRDYGVDALDWVRTKTNI